VRPIIIIGSMDVEFCLVARHLIAQEDFEAVLTTGRSNNAAADHRPGRSPVSPADIARGNSSSPDDLRPRRDEIPDRLGVPDASLRLSCGDIEMDLLARRVWRSSVEIHLPPIEFAILQSFLSVPDRVFLRKELIEMAWRPGIFVDPKTVDVHVGRLRRAMTITFPTDPIRTVRGVGYALDARMATSLARE
jgi:two-component system phosphate regulon response regulator PhoB